VKERIVGVLVKRWNFRLQALGIYFDFILRQKNLVSSGRHNIK
jgi:hypothetical protein